MLHLAAEIVAYLADSLERHIRGCCFGLDEILFCNTKLSVGYQEITTVIMELCIKPLTTLWLAQTH